MTIARSLFADSAVRAAGSRAEAALIFCSQALLITWRLVCLSMQQRSTHFVETIFFDVKLAMLSEENLEARGGLPTCPSSPAVDDLALLGTLLFLTGLALTGVVDVVDVVAGLE